MGIKSTLNHFPRTFWVANTIELFERWAWYGFFMLFANYLTGSSDIGGLEFTQAQKGLIMGFGTGILYFLPVITGSIADHYGYKKILVLAFSIYVSGFLMLSQVHSFWSVFFVYLYLALGGALFKPIISATVAKLTNEKTSSIGFGIFYMMVNIGSFFGPLITLLFKKSAYEWVFYTSACIIGVNFILLLFYKEPHRLTQDKPLLKSLNQVLKNTISVLKDIKFVLFLIIVAGFWTMYNQLFFTLPVFISQWVDTSNIYQLFAHYMPFFSDNYGTAQGQMEAEFITNLDAMFIIGFQILISTLVMNIKPLKSMMVGFAVCSIGMALTLFTQNVWFTLIAMFIFSLGEMAGSPKISEYIGRIAPADKKALYMGYSYIPMFLGTVFAGFISGNVYQKMSDKTVFVKELAVQKELNISGDLSQNAYFDLVAEKMNMSHQQLTHYLWEQYQPSQIWYIILGIGLLSVLSLWVYDQRLISKNT